MKKVFGIQLGLAGVVLFLMTGCATRTGYREVVVSGPPPAYVTESVSVAPGPSYVLIPGGWVWRDHKWAWEPGRWVVPPRPGALWHPGHFYHRDGRYYYRPGYWS